MKNKYNKNNSKCQWKSPKIFEDERAYVVGCCGETFCFTEGGPEENKVRYCPFCGNEIKIEEK